MWIRALALAAAALFLAPFAYGVSPLLGAILVLVAVSGVAWALATGLSPYLRKRDPYDLDELRRVHEDEERRSVEPEGALRDGDRIVCPRCYEEFDARLRVCPRCGGG